MKTHKYETKEEWLAARRGKITGSRLKDIVVKRGTGKKIGFWELVSEGLGVAPEDESAMERGSRLEPEALERFAKESGKKIDTSLVIWTREDDESIAISPDGFVGKKEAVETKCLSSARHIEAFFTQKVPDEYEFQTLQYFIVNDNLKTLYLVFYDPRILVKDYFVLTIERKDKEEDIKQYLQYQKDTMKEVREYINQLTF
jgi:putative phage-type endonuclease